MLRSHTEKPDDVFEVEALFDLCFAPGRTALSSYRLRDDVAPVAGLCHIMRDDYDILAAAIRFWPIRIGESGSAALLLGPIAVHPTRQGEGLGASIIGNALLAAEDAGWSRVLLIGDEPYYARFGFTRDLAQGLEFPPPTNPDRLLARELVPGAMEGVTGLVRPWNKIPPAGGD